MSFFLTSNFDGRSRLSQAVLAALQDRVGDDFDQNWGSKTSHDSKPFVNFWNLPRSKGYIVSVVNDRLSKQVNLGVFQMPNSDEIGVALHQSGIDSGIDAKDFPDGDSDNFSLETFKFDAIYKAASYVYDQLLNFTRREL